MVVSEVAITVSIELLARRAELSLGSILVYRSLLALVLLAAIVQPGRAEWLPRSPWVALLRVLTGGLTYVGWFGAIALLSGRVTQAVLLLDALILAYVHGERQSYERRTLLVLAAALVLFAVQACREPGTVLNARRGILFLLIALGSRAATYKVWELAQGKGEHLFWLIAPALVWVEPWAECSLSLRRWDMVDCSRFRCKRGAQCYWWRWSDSPATST
jgi:hypothetical protein